MSCFSDAHAKFIRYLLLDSSFGCLHVYAHISAQEVIGINVAKCHIGIGDGGLCATQFIAGWTGLCARTLWPDVNGPGTVKPYNTASAGAYFNHIHNRCAYEVLTICPELSDIPREDVVCFDEYVGPGYSLPTPEMAEATRMLARIEGILIDPVYTGKAMAGLIDLARKGYFSKDEHVVFIHTGGSTALYVYMSDILE